MPINKRDPLQRQTEREIGWCEVLVDWRWSEQSRALIFQIAVKQTNHTNEILRTMGYNGHFYRSLPKSAEKHWVLKVAPILRAFAIADEVSRTVSFISLFTLVHTALHRPIRGGRRNNKKALNSLINRINRIGQPQDLNDAKEVPIRVEEPIIRPVDDPQVADEKKQERPDADRDEEKEPRLSKRR